MDIGHVILGALIVVLVATKLRTRRSRRFGLTITVQREGDEEAESTRDATKPPDSSPGA